MRKLLNLEQAAALLNCEEGTVRNLMYHRRVPYLKVGGRVRFDAQQLEEYLQSSQVVSTAEAAGKGVAA